MGICGGSWHGNIMARRNMKNKISAAKAAAKMAWRIWRGGISAKNRKYQ
jgi:hypothetical protein